MYFARALTITAFERGPDRILPGLIVFSPLEMRF
jgi:hypothetical protein